jgi:hypothetical protein
MPKRLPGQSARNWEYDGRYLVRFVGEDRPIRHEILSYLASWVAVTEPPKMYATLVVSPIVYRRQMCGIYRALPLFRDVRTIAGPVLPVFLSVIRG